MSFSAMPGRLLLRSRLSTCLPKLPHQFRPYTLPTTPRAASVISSLASKQRNAFRSLSFSSKPNQSAATIPKPGTSPLPNLADSISRPAKAAAAWPEISDRKVGYWLLGSATLVFGIVVLGGLTRLTESGFVVLNTPEKSVVLTDSPVSQSRNGSR
jgi:cytochrome c oxidase assembly protein subunit 15